jgi:hypothetical protein
MQSLPVHLVHVPVPATFPQRFVFRTSYRFTTSPFNRFISSPLHRFTASPLTEHIQALVRLFNAVTLTTREKSFGQTERGSEKRMKKITLGKGSKFISFIKFNYVGGIKRHA